MGYRNAVFAGSWYPGDEQGCVREIRAFTSDADRGTSGRTGFMGGIVPHAGWYFSGAIACNVIRRIGRGQAPDTVVVFGVHMHAGSAPILETNGAWQTPLGDMAIDEEMAEVLSGRISFRTDRAGDFSRDNTIEVQLPFVRHFMPGARLLPIGVPPSSSAIDVGETVAAVAAELGRTVRVIGSTDLTHYGPNYGFMPEGTGTEAVNWVKRENDRRVVDAMLTMDPSQVLREGTSRQSACCAGAAAAAIVAARALGATTAERMTYATSFDKSPGASFVGYVGIGFR